MKDKNFSTNAQMVKFISPCLHWLSNFIMLTIKRKKALTGFLQSLLSDSNQRPRDYKSRALAN